MSISAALMHGRWMQARMVSPVCIRMPSPNPLYVHPVPQPNTLSPVYTPMRLAFVVRLGCTTRYQHLTEGIIIIIMRHKGKLGWDDKELHFEDEDLRGKEKVK